MALRARESIGACADDSRAETHAKELRPFNEFDMGGTSPLVIFIIHAMSGQAGRSAAAPLDRETIPNGSIGTSLARLRKRGANLFPVYDPRSRFYGRLFGKS